MDQDMTLSGFLSSIKAPGTQAGRRPILLLFHVGAKSWVGPLLRQITRWGNTMIFSHAMVFLLPLKETFGYSSDCGHGFQNRKPRHGLQCHKKGTYQIKSE